MLAAWTAVMSGIPETVEVERDGMGRQHTETLAVVQNRVGFLAASVVFLLLNIHPYQVPQVNCSIVRHENPCTYFWSNSSTVCETLAATILYRLMSLNAALIALLSMYPICTHPPSPLDTFPHSTN